MMPSIIAIGPLNIDGVNNCYANMLILLMKSRTLVGFGSLASSHHDQGDLKFDARSWPSEAVGARDCHGKLMNSSLSARLSSIVAWITRAWLIAESCVALSPPAQLFFGPTTTS